MPRVAFSDNLPFTGAGAGAGGSAIAITGVLALLAETSSDTFAFSSAMGI